MARIVATFANGYTKTIANSRRPYTHAWRWTSTDAAGAVHGNCGFITDGSQALKTATSDYAFHARWASKDRKPAFGPVAVEVVPVVVDGNG